MTSKKSVNLSSSLLSVYFFALITAGISYFVTQYEQMNPESGYSESILLRLIVTVGVVASAARGGAELFSETGKRKLKKESGFSVSAYIMRPLQGGAFAIITYFIFRAAMLIFEQGWPTINPWGFFAVAGLAGMFVTRISMKPSTKTHPQAWLLKKRTEIFEEFLRTQEKCHNEASRWLTGNDQEHVRETKIREIYEPVFVRAKIIRLYVKKESKSHVEKLAKEIYDLHRDPPANNNILIALQQKLEELQDIFEDHLRNRGKG